MMRTATIAALAATLVACQPRDHADPAEAAPAPAAAEAADGVVRGTAHYLERIAMPPGSSLEMRLVRLDGGGERQVAAREVVDGVENPPYPFELRYDATVMMPDARYGLELTLRDDQGRERFASPAALPVEAGETDVGEVRLVASRGDSPRDRMATSDRGYAWECDGERFTTRLDGDVLLLTRADGQELRLAPAVSASGARFSDGRNEFWSHGAEEAALELEGGPRRSCTAVRVEGE